MLVRQLVAGVDSLARLAYTADTVYIVLFTTTLPFIFTYLYSFLRYCVQTSRREQCQEPITPPYLVPGGGHVLPLIFKPTRFLRNIQSYGLPAYLALPRGGFYFAIPGEQVQKLLISRDLVPTPSLSDAFMTFFGLPQQDSKVFEHDHISRFESRTGLTTSHTDPSRRLMEHQRKDFTVYLQGDNLKLIMSRFLLNFRTEISTGYEDWVCLPDLHRFMINRIFRAEVQAIYGESIFTVCPSLCADFWAFYEALPMIARKVPKWLFPSCYKTREKMLRNFREWRIWCKMTFDADNEDLHDIEYEPIWGARYIRRMVKRHEDLELSDMGIATAMLGYFFVTMANSIPAALWMILHIIRDRDLVLRVRSELSTAFSSSSGQLDISGLTATPLLGSIYCETLRLRVASTVGRTSPHSEFRLAGDWKVGPGIPIMTAGWLGGLSDSFWNTGHIMPDGTPEHPLDTFWAERFLEYPDDSMSGPIRKSRGFKHTTENIRLKTADDDRRAKLITAGLQGHWFPFGGGISRCPGETLAKQTVLASVVLVMQCLDLEPLNPAEAMKTGSSHRTLPFGSHAFDRSVPIRVRHRQY